MNAQNDGPNGDGEIDRDNLFLDVTKQMLVGAGVAAAVVVIPGVFIFGLYLIGELLPPESKEAVDPTPDSFSSYQIEVTSEVV